MAYTILNSNGTVLTTIADGTINTTSTSLGLPGRNYAGYGQVLDTNFVQMLENFAGTTPPSNPIQGQLWYNTNTNTLYVCPVTGTTNANNWLSLTSTSSGGTTTFGAITVTGNVAANNLSATNSITANSATLSYLTVSTTATLSNVTATTATLGTINSANITTGGSSTNGTMTGVWTITGSGTANSVAGTTAWVNGGNLVISGAPSVGIRTDNYYYANGTPISFAGSYSNTNVSGYLPVYGGNILTTQTQAVVLTTGANTTPGTITGNWTLSAGSRLQSTYADLAERYYSDDNYPVGTVVKVGGINEITQINDENDTHDVLGVISNSYAYLMNAEAGGNETHPPVGLTGRLLVRVVGPIAKGNKIAASSNGCAVMSSDATGFGWALESSNDANEKLLLCVVK